MIVRKHAHINASANVPMCDRKLGTSAARTSASTLAKTITAYTIRTDLGNWDQCETRGSPAGVFDNPKTPPNNSRRSMTNTNSATVSTINRTGIQNWGSSSAFLSDLSNSAVSEPTAISSGTAAPKYRGAHFLSTSALGSERLGMLGISNR